MTTEQRVFGASEESVTLERSFFFQATTFVRKPPALGSAMSSTVTAMSFTVTHATDTPTEDDAATPAPNFDASEAFRKTSWSLTF